MRVAAENRVMPQVSAARYAAMILTLARGATRLDQDVRVWASE